MHDFEGLTAVGTDNTNANMYEHHSVLSLFREDIFSEKNRKQSNIKNSLYEI